MKSFSNYILIFVFTLISFTSFAQQEVAMADTMRSEGKIYVIVGIILIVLAGLIAYLFLLDRKVTRLEERLPKKG